MAAGKPDLALEQFQKAAAIDPDNPTTGTGVALAEIGAGKAKEGLAELERVFSSDTGTTVAGPALVLAQLRTGQIDKAADAAAKLVGRDAKNVLYQTLLGMVRVRQGDNAGAETALRAAVALQPGSGAAARNLAHLFLATGRPDDAAKTYGDILAKKPNDVAGLLGLAEVAVAQQKWDQAADYTSRAQTAAPDDPVPGIHRVNLNLLRNDAAQAKSVADQLAAQFPANPDVLDAQGRALVAAGDSKGAVSTYKRAYELAPKSQAVFARYLTLLLAEKNFTEARTVLQQGVDRNPANAGLKIDLIRVDGQAGGVDAGIAKARSFAKDDPDNAVYDLVSAELYEKAGRNDDARTRVSTGDQDVAGQTLRLTQAGALKVFTDVRSGRSMDRPGLDALLAFAREGDTLAVVRLDRLGRSLGELLATVAMLKERGIALVSLEEKIRQRLGRWRADLPCVRGDRAFRAAADRRTNKRRNRRRPRPQQTARASAPRCR
jgi:predicted Zn-dependent protease